MKKLLAAVVVLLIAAGLGAPYVSGLVAEREIRGTIEKTNKLYGDAALGITAEITRYDRGFSSSEVEWRVNLGKMSSLYGVKELLFQDQLKHEMTGVVATTSLARIPQYQEFVKTKLAGKDPLHITTRYALTGGMESTFVVDAFSITDGAQTLQVKPARFVGSADKELKRFIMDGSWEGLSANGVGALDTVSMKGDLTMESIYLGTGNVAMVVKGCRVENPQEPFTLANVIINYSLAHDKSANKLSGKLEYGADSLSVGEKKIEKAFVRLAMNGVNATAYEELMRLYMTAFNKILTEAGGNGQDPAQLEQAFEQQMGQIGMQLMGPAEKLLTKGLELQISDMHVTLPEGEVTGNVSVGLAKDMTFAQFMPLVNQPELAMQIFTLKSNCSLPTKLLGGDPTLVQPAFPGMQTGVFVVRGDRAEHRAEIKDGKLLLNDKEVQLQ